MSLLRPGKRVSQLPWMEAPYQLMLFNSLPTQASSLRERFLFPVLRPGSFSKGPQQVLLSDLPQTGAVAVPGAVPLVQPGGSLFTPILLHRAMCLRVIAEQFPAVCT